MRILYGGGGQPILSWRKYSQERSVDLEKWCAPLLGCTLIFLILLSVPLFAGDLFEEGFSQLKSERYDEIIEAFTATIERIPNDYESYTKRGIAWFYKGDHARAIQDFSKAVSINPAFAEAYNNRGTVLFSQKKYKDAVADFTDALEKNPQYSEAYFNRCTTWFHTGEYGKGIADCSETLRIDPFNADAYHQLALTLAICPDERFRDPEKAVKLAQKAIELKPVAAYLDTLAAAYSQSGNFKNAAETQEKAIALLEKEGKTENLDEYVKRRKIYENNKPLRKKSSPLMGEKRKTGSGKAGTGQDKKTVKRGGEERTSEIKEAGYPYTIQVSSYRKKESAMEVLNKLADRGDPVFMAFVRIPGKGNWFRIFIGHYPNRKRANDAAMKLKNRKFLYAEVVRKPYAVQAGIFGSKGEAVKLRDALESKGYPSYTLGPGGEGDMIKLMVGAFGSRNKALDQALLLRKNGFSAQIVKR